MMTTLPNRVSALFADPLQSVFRGVPANFPWDSGTDATQSQVRKFAPMSAWDNGDSVYIEVDVPGIRLSDLDVSLQKGRLTIRGQRQKTQLQSEFRHDERFYGEFERNVVLADWIDPSSIEATLREGVLQLKLLKKPEAQPQRIAIRDAGGSDSKRIENHSP